MIPVMATTLRLSSYTSLQAAALDATRSPTAACILTSLVVRLDRTGQRRPGRRPVMRAARRSTHSGENTGRKVVARWMTTATPHPSSGQ